MRFNRLSLLVFLSLGTLYLSQVSCKQAPKTIKQTEVVFKKEAELTIFKSDTDSIITKLDIEVANTDYEIQTGLMYRDSMKDDQGMLFVFSDVKERQFYMKNTRIPLDLIFIDSNKKIVSFQKDAKPFNEASLPSNAPAKYVLEVNSGLVDTLRISVGDSIHFVEYKQP